MISVAFYSLLHDDGSAVLVYMSCVLSFHHAKSLRLAVAVSVAEMKPTGPLNSLVYLYHNYALWPVKQLGVPIP